LKLSIPREVWLIASILLLGGLFHGSAAQQPPWAAEFWQPSSFTSVGNVSRMIQHASMVGIFALGAGIVIIAGGIDLSTGSVICFTGVVCARAPLWTAGLLSAWIDTGTCPAGLAWFFDRAGLLTTETLSLAMIVWMILFTTVAGTLVGLLHSLLIVRLDLPPFVATLSTMAGLRSLSSLISTGVVGISDDFRFFAKPWYMPVAIVVVEFILLSVLMRLTRVGRHLEALGGNEQAARLSGLSVPRLKLVTYLLAALTSTLGGFVTLAFVGSAGPQSGIGYELIAIAAAVIGGCNLRGGSGSLLGVLLGCVLLKMVSFGSSYVIPRSWELSSRATEAEGLIVGVVVILAVFLGKLGSGR
jgi:ribose/xylose/arabinose/galactoside ABC-type transport system permease subunit